MSADRRIITKLMFKLLPIQILLAVVGAINGMVSSYFAANYVGVTAMSAVGLYGPIQLLLTAISTLIFGGSVILCGKYMGEDAQEKQENVFSLSIILSILAGALLAVLFRALALGDLTGFITQDETVRAIFNRYLLGQSIGVFPLLTGNLLAAFLSMENQRKRTLIASISYIVSNLILNLLFLQVFHLETFGLALASSLGMWVYLCVLGQYYFSGKAHLQLR